MPDAARARNDRRSRSPLAERPFRILFLGQAVSAFGNQVAPIALAFAVLDLTGSASDLGLVLAAALAPRLVFLVVGGVWADRLPKARVMLVADAVRALAQALIAAELLAGRAQVSQLAVLGAIEGMAGAFFQPAVGALVPATVSAERLQSANALLAMARNAAGVFGPAVGGVLVASAGAGFAFAVDSATFAVSAVSLALLRVPHLPTARAPFRSELREGLGELLARQWYWSNIISHCLWNGMMAAFFVLGPLVCAQRLGGAAAWSTVLVAGALGSVVAGALALRLRPARPLVAGNVCLALAALPLLALVQPLPVLAVAAATALAMGGLAYMSALWETAVQTHIPPHALSRVMAWDWLASLVVAPLGRVAVGPLAMVAGLRWTLVGAALVLALSSLGVLLVPSVRSLRAGPPPAAAPELQPEPEPEVLFV